MQNRFFWVIVKAAASIAFNVVLVVAAYKTKAPNRGRYIR